MSDLFADELGDEFALIDWIHQCSKTISAPGLSTGIGDDTAVFQSTAGAMLATVDTLVEGTHFTFESATPEQIGRKALAVNLSDIAAMAGTPTYALLSLTSPRTLDQNILKRVVSGLVELATEFNVALIGGDTNSTDGLFSISVTLLGMAPKSGAILRTGSQVGDAIMVTGAIGGSLPSGRHLNFSPRVAEAKAICTAANVHAMLDVSDGIASDIRHLLQSQKLGAIIDVDAIPIHADVPTELSTQERLQCALCDGEDFELLFTVDAKEADRLSRDETLSVNVTRIGTITDSGELLLRSGDSTSPINNTGWSHPIGD